MRLTAVLFLSLGFSQAIADDCSHFAMENLAGVFQQIEYTCEEKTASGTRCYTKADPYVRVSEIELMPVPLGVEVGLSVEFFEIVGLTTRTVLQDTFSRTSAAAEGQLSCRTFEEDGIRVYQIKKESTLAGLKSFFQVTTKRSGVEIELNSSYFGASSRYLFRGLKAE